VEWILYIRDGDIEDETSGESFKNACKLNID